MLEDFVILPYPASRIIGISLASGIHHVLCINHNIALELPSVTKMHFMVHVFHDNEYWLTLPSSHNLHIFNDGVFLKPNRTYII